MAWPKKLPYLHIVVEITKSEMRYRDSIISGFHFENKKDEQDRGQLTVSLSLIMSYTQLTSIYPTHRNPHAPSLPHTSTPTLCY